MSKPTIFRNKIIEVEFYSLYNTSQDPSRLSMFITEGEGGYTYNNDIWTVEITGCGVN